ncbi:3-dehydroquinate synthase [Aliikangiella coralliicola]|uniref:3-dehydroquinate synthase n=1 Tax=Aliikangiella coralliicola TaxID=2592383 RepID=A0A545UHK9_9GAMM|nr:3-dehydroquinate synthase [Aliikangiella coralliicola]TQV88950.1 3-dehydroquinate synthase [Aliikangiella coralliicola]
MRQLALDLGERSYGIYIKEGLLTDSQLFSQFCRGENILILSNDMVAPLYFEQLKTSLPDKTIHQFILPDGEIYKNLSHYSEVLDYLVTQGFRRNDTLIALGGGVVGDLGGFVAASYQRGMGFIQVPTSLLAQVDSSVGGKTAVNHPLGKNMIGAFYQPLAVIIDTNTLDSLPEKEFVSGLAEVAKYAMLGANEVNKLLTEDTAAVLARDKTKLADLIYYSCAKKAQVVAEDEEEKGNRALLNLGHTFGHALERLTDYKRYLHGEAVAIGIHIAINLSLEKTLIAPKTAELYRNLLNKLGLPDKAEIVANTGDFLEAMKLDKKNVSDKYRLVLPTDSACVIVEEDDIEMMGRAITQQLVAA